MMKLQLLTPFLLGLAACNSTGMPAEVSPDSKWEVVASGISHTRLTEIQLAAKDPSWNNQSSRFGCRYMVSGRDVLWIESRIRRIGKKLSKPPSDDVGGYYVITEVETGRQLIETTWEMIRTSDGTWYSYIYEDLGDVFRFIREKAREAGCWAG